MLTRVDHVMICVPDLQQGIDAYARIGFNIYPGGVHPGRGTHNAIAFHQEDYLELLSVRDRDEHVAAAAAPGSPDMGLGEFLAAGGGFRSVIVQSDDLAADVAAMRRRGVEVSGAIEGGRRTPAGQELRWKVAILGPRNLLPILFIQHLTPYPGPAGGTQGCLAPEWPRAASGFHARQPLRRGAGVRPSGDFRSRGLRQARLVRAPRRRAVVQWPSAGARTACQTSVSPASKRRCASAWVTCASAPSCPSSPRAASTGRCRARRYARSSS